MATGVGSPLRFKTIFHNKGSGTTNYLGQTEWDHKGLRRSKIQETVPLKQRLTANVDSPYPEAYVEKTTSNYKSDYKLINKTHLHINITQKNALNFTNQPSKRNELRRWVKRKCSTHCCVIGLFTWKINPRNVYPAQGLMIHSESIFFKRERDFSVH